MLKPLLILAAGVIVALAVLSVFTFKQEPEVPELRLGAGTVFNDTFTTGSDVALSAHTPDTGTSWTMLWQTGATSDFSVIDATDRARAASTQSNSGVMYTADATYPSADYTVDVVASAGCTGSNRCFVLARVQDQENMYALRYTTGAGTVSRLYKKVSGSWSALSGSFFADPDVGQTLQLEVEGTTISWYADGVLQESVSDSDIATAGKAGLAMGGGTELVASTDDILSTNAFDNFVVTDLAPAPSGGGTTQVIYFD